MSEHQTYEFLAIDQPLDQAAMDWLRSLSSRADISPNRFYNEYNYGDFRGRPMELMRRHFDLHLYLANFGAATFMVRVPLSALEADRVMAFGTDDTFSAERTSSHWILDWRLMDEEGDSDAFWTDDSGGWLARLMPIREELLRGDLRALYIGWLQAVMLGEVDDDELEPLLLPGLGQLTPAQQALAELMGVDADLLEAAGMGSPELDDEDDQLADMGAWLDSLSMGEARPYLRCLLCGEAREAESRVRRDYLAWRREHDAGPSPSGAPRRRVGELRANVDAARQQREAREQRQREAAEAERRRARAAHLALVFQNAETHWQQADRQAALGSRRGYEEATRLLRDLADACRQQDQAAAFQQRLGEFVEKYRRRRKLMEGLRKAGLAVEV